MTLMSLKVNTGVEAMGGYGDIRSCGWLLYGLISMNILVFVVEFLLGYGILTSADLKVSNLKLDG